MQLMIALVSDVENKPRSTASLANELAIPLPFLHQISHSLMQAGFIKATPGPRGGIRLNQPAASISSRQIVEALEGPIDINPASENIQGENRVDPSSRAEDLWQEIEIQLIQYLDHQNLEELSKHGPKALFSEYPVNKTRGQLIIN
ncbi:MAG: Rrf2 family transcriptional regulator [Anaerolineaceae bacterium]|nr:Rrf2 family transcriptional regulator [Anaerolineaceae bacterium]